MLFNASFSTISGDRDGNVALVTLMLDIEINRDGNDTQLKRLILHKIIAARYGRRKPFLITQQTQTNKYAHTHKYLYMNDLYTYIYIF